MVLNFIRGFCMALADSVPGVSGVRLLSCSAFMINLSAL